MTISNYIPIDALMERLASNKYLKDVGRDMVIQHVVDFYEMLNMRKCYVEKNDVVKIYKHRGILPCSLVELIQVKDLKTGFCLTSSTDNFMLSEFNHTNDFTFKQVGHAIITSFPHGEVMVDYLSVPEENGEPMLIDNNLFLKTLELHIKLEVYKDLFEDGKINANVFTMVEQDYYYMKGKLAERLSTPSESEIQALTNEIHRPVWQTQFDFITGYKFANNLHRRRVKK